MFNGKLYCLSSPGSLLFKDMAASHEGCIWELAQSPIHRSTAEKLSEWTESWPAVHKALHGFNGQILVDLNRLSTEWEDLQQQACKAQGGFMQWVQFVAKLKGTLFSDLKFGFATSSL